MVFIENLMDIFLNADQSHHKCPTTDGVFKIIFISLILTLPWTWLLILTWTMRTVSLWASSTTLSHFMLIITNISRDVEISLLSNTVDNQNIIIWGGRSLSILCFDLFIALNCFSYPWLQFLCERLDCYYRQKVIAYYVVLIFEVSHYMAQQLMSLGWGTWGSFLNAWQDTLSLHR